MIMFDVLWNHHWALCHSRVRSVLSQKFMGFNRVCHSRVRAVVSEKFLRTIQVIYLILGDIPTRGVMDLTTQKE